jgi:CubicO group peptidase (beta-lactamase class C family)
MAAVAAAAPRAPWLRAVAPYNWWIVPRLAGPSDFCAIGHHGQFIHVSPQYDVVFVRAGPGRGEWGDRDWTELFYFAAERL